MKIAIYQGFLFHYEMLGYIIDYLLNSKLVQFDQIDIYCWNLNNENNNSNNGKAWEDFYQDIFKIKINFIEPCKINPDNYNIIFLITDDDLSFKQEWLDKIGESKIICIDHFAERIRPPTNMTRVGVRFFYHRPKCLWAMPVYQYINKIDKIKYLSQTNKINIVCVGKQGVPISGEFLKELFYNFDSLEFHIISRKIEPKFNYSNIKTYENCSTKIMMEIIKNAHYMLCFEDPKNLGPISGSLSASIPLAFNSGCQLIIPKSWQNYYNLNSIISYEDSLLQKNNSTSKMFLTAQTDLDKIYNEAYDLIHHKNYVFDSILKNKFGCTYSNISNNLLTYIYDMIINDKPIIAIDLSDNKIKIKNFVNDFREMNCFINENLNNNKIFYHSDKQFFLTNTINKINEPCFINIEYNDLTQIYLLHLSKRSYNDLILITNINNNTIQIIKNNFNKMHCLYSVNNDSIIIISQK